MDIEMLMNFIIHILAIFGLFLLLFLFVKFVLWCLMCDIDPINDVERTKLQFQLNRIEQSSKQKNSSNNNQTNSYRKSSSEPFPEVRLKRSPEIERLNSENLLINSEMLNKSTESCNSLTDSENEFLMIEKMDNDVYDSESNLPIRKKENDEKITELSCIEHSKSTLNYCVCPYCSKTNDEHVHNVQNDIQNNDDDDGQISIEIEPEIAENFTIIETEISQSKTEASSSSLSSSSSTATATAAATEAATDIKIAFKELDNVIEEMNDFIIHEIDQNIDTSIWEKNDSQEEKNELNMNKEKPQILQKPKIFSLRAAGKIQPQCVSFSQVVDQLKQRNSQIINSNDVTP